MILLTLNLKCQSPNPTEKLPRNRPLLKIPFWKVKQDLKIYNQNLNLWLRRTQVKTLKRQPLKVLKILRKGCPQCRGKLSPKETEPSGSGSHAPTPGYASDVYEKPSSNQGSVTESQIDYSERLEDQEDELLSAKIPIVYTGTAPKTPPPVQPHQAREDMKLSYGGTVPQRVSNIPLQAAAGHEDGDQDSNNSSDTIDYNPDEEAPPKIADGSGPTDPDSRAALEQRIMAELAEVSKPRKKRKANRIFQCSQCSFVVSIYQHLHS